MAAGAWKKYVALGVALLLVFAAIVLFGREKTTPVQHARLHILTTFLPLYVFTTNIVGDAANVENILPPGVGPHEYAFTPADIRRFADADVVVMNGLGLEGWMQQLISQSGTHAQIVVASDGIREPAVAGAEDGTTDHPGVNPHVWLDPVRAQEMTLWIAEQLAVADPANAALYRTNAAAYTKTLAALDDEYAKTLSAFSPAARSFIAFHPALAYLAERYGLAQVAVIEEFPGKEPSATYLASIVDMIRAKKVSALFSEPQFSPKVVQTVAAETGMTVQEIDTVETGDLAPETYVRVMQKNLQAFVAAFADPI